MYKVNQVEGEISENIAIHIAIHFGILHCKIQQFTALVLAYMCTYPGQIIHVYTTMSVHTCMCTHIHVRRQYTHVYTSRSIHTVFSFRCTHPDKYNHGYTSRSIHVHSCNKNLPNKESQSECCDRH